MTDAHGPEIEIVPDTLFERRRQDWLFQVATNGALSYLSADGKLGWQGLAPAAAIEYSLSRGQLAEWRTNADATEVMLTWRYPRLPMTEAMTVRLRESPAAMIVDRVLRNDGPTPLKVHEVRMLTVDGGGVQFAGHSPADLRCVYLGDLHQAGQVDSPAIVPLPVSGRILGEPQDHSLPAMAICDVVLRTFLLEASLGQEVFGRMWQMVAHANWRQGRSVLADYAAISRNARMQPLLLPGGEQRTVSRLFYQIKHDSALAALYEDCLLEQ
jgi:hypothetical protein